MINSNTRSQQNTYTEARARDVFGKVKDDFINAGLRGFTTISKSTLNSWWEDVAFVANKKALEKCELQFHWSGGQAAIIYEVVSDGGIHINSDSAAHNFYAIPKDAKVSIVIRRDRSNEEVSTYLSKQGWTSSGSFIEGSTQDSGGYSKDGYGVNIKTIGL